MEIGLKITLDCSPRLESIVKDIMSLAHRQAVEEPTAAPTATPAKEATATPVAKPKTAKPKAEKPAPVAEPQQPTTTPTAAPEPAGEEAKAPSIEDVRAAMQAVRDRLEYGTPEEGQSKGPATEADQSIHRQLTKTFKEISKTLGANKPSELPNSQYGEFINRIGGLSVYDGNVVPF